MLTFRVVSRQLKAAVNHFQVAPLCENDRYFCGIKSTRTDYRTSMFSFRVVRQQNLDAVIRAFQRVPSGDEVDAGLPEVPGFHPKMGARSLGTLQAATLLVKQASEAWRAGSLFAVVTRRVPPWARGQQEREKYAMAVAFQDLSDLDVRLHTQVRANLRERARVRIRP